MWTITLLLIPQPHLLSFNHFLFFIFFFLFVTFSRHLLLHLASFWEACFLTEVFFSGSRVLFTRPPSTIFSKKNFKTRSHGTIHTFKIYFITVFSIFSNFLLKMGLTVLFTHLKNILLQCFQFSIFSFSNNKFNPNGPII